MRISVHPERGVIVTLPKGLTDAMAHRFVEQKRVWIESKLSNHDHIQDNTLNRLTPEDYKKYKEVAREIISDRVEYFSKILGFSYNHIHIRNQKTRWGSCSSKGNLNFSYKIMFLPDELRDYVVVHELCHLKEMNHSERFWRLVESIIPNYKEIKGKIRTEYVL